MDAILGTARVPAVRGRRRQVAAGQTRQVDPLTGQRPDALTGGPQNVEPGASFLPVAGHYVPGHAVDETAALVADHQQERRKVAESDLGQTANRKISDLPPRRLHAASHRARSGPAHPHLPPTASLVVLAMASTAPRHVRKDAPIIRPREDLTVQRYWLEFEHAADLRPDTVLGRGVGVTAWTVSHALRMLEWYFGPPLPSVAGVVENVNVSVLVLPACDCGVPVWPGIWRPGANLWLRSKNDWPD